MTDASNTDRTADRNADPAAAQSIAQSADAAQSAAPVTCTIAGVNCRIEPHTLGYDWAQRFDAFAVPEWACADPLRCTITDALVRRLAGRHPHLSLRQLEADALCHTTLTGLANRGVIAAHGICIAYQGRAYLFSSADPLDAERHALLWRQYLGDDVTLVGDGWVALSETGRSRDAYISASGTPWVARRGWSRNVTLPLGAWTIVRPLGAGGADGPSVERMDATELVDVVMRHLFMPDEPRAVTNALSALDRVAMLTPVFRCRCGVDERGVALSFERLTGRSFADARVAQVWPLPAASRVWDSRGGGVCDLGVSG